MPNFLSKEYWEQRYTDSAALWDMGAVSPPLKAYLDQIENKNARILIPGCGNAYEAEYALKSGFTNITVVDFAEEPVARLKIALQEYPKENYSIIQGDFFDHNGAYDVILEQTFFCALNPNLRNNYAIKMTQLLAPEGVLAGVLFASEFEKEGPPFGGTQHEYEALFSPLFQIKTMEPCYNSHPKRQGNELFIELVKR